MKESAEHLRLHLANKGLAPWQKWGPYLAERQWGTVREDYSADGDAWRYFTHDAARSRAYRWGEDGIAGVSDDDQILCLAVAFWNGRDPILKERFFGLNGEEGNHGEDVKELYYYLDNTPTHSYMKMLYKYPQVEFPYARLVEENRSRNRQQPEFELADTGVFDGDRYFDIFIEYAKASPEDILMKITAFNRGPDVAALHLLPHLWFRNTWSWEPGREKPLVSAVDGQTMLAHHPGIGDSWLTLEGDHEALFCENETNVRRLFQEDGPPGYFKDGINEQVVHGTPGAVNPSREGTKAAAHYEFSIPPGGSASVRVRLSRQRPDHPFGKFEELLALRKEEADAFYASLQDGMTNRDAREVQRQAFAGLLWSKQFYRYEVSRWLAGDPLQPPPPPERLHGRNAEWVHLDNADVLSMPDTWEYPWYASWDLAFQCLPLALIDPEFAKRQLILLTREWYMHPSGQIPAYEWAFGGANPPVHAWAAWRVYEIDQAANDGKGDEEFLERVFHKLLLNFTWWVNRKDTEGRNIFQGGFLGLDNIGVFDRNAELPTGGHLEQADATSWMAMYSLNMMRIALELSRVTPVYQDLATKFFEHFLYIAGAMVDIGGKGISLWDQEDEFFYDALHRPDGRNTPLRVRSIVGLIPLFAVETLDPELVERLPEFRQRLEWFLSHRPELASLVSRWHQPGEGERRLLSLLRGHRMKCLLRRMLDENEFLSPHGIRALSRYHAAHPYRFDSNGSSFEVNYEPAESETALFGGNSNWRGPVWFPLNYLLIESLLRFHHYYGNDFKVECPTGSGRFLTLQEIAGELTGRLTTIFTRGGDGRRVVFGDREKFQEDPNFRDALLFHEYFHGETGAGLGASHQTGWTGLLAMLLMPRERKAAETARKRPAGRTQPARRRMRTQK